MKSPKKIIARASLGVIVFMIAILSGCATFGIIVGVHALSLAMQSIFALALAGLGATFILATGNNHREIPPQL